MILRCSKYNTWSPSYRLVRAPVPCCTVDDQRDERPHSILHEHYMYLCTLASPRFLPIVVACCRFFLAIGRQAGIDTSAAAPPAVLMKMQKQGVKQQMKEFEVQEYLFCPSNSTPPTRLFAHLPACLPACPTSPSNCP